MKPLTNISNFNDGNKETSLLTKGCKIVEVI